jgi:signal transduction histidine kinase
MMRRPFTWRPEWVFYLCVGLLFGATFFRAMLHYATIPDALVRSLLLLLVWLLLLLSQPMVSRRWQGYFPLYLFIQSSITFVLLFNPDPPDFFALLYAILSAQVVVNFRPRLAIFCIVLFAVLTFVPVLRVMSPGMAAGTTLVYAASNALLAAYVMVNLRTRAVRLQNQATNLELQEANRKLREYSSLVSEITAARERNRLARDLHDSVTQSIFSMTLAVQSTLLLLERDPKRVGEQLSHIGDLAQSAQVELQTLITELNPQKSPEVHLAQALARHIKERSFPEGLEVSLDVEGESHFEVAEEQGLFRIAQESLNNIVKHAGATRANIRLHLAEPFWMEIQDNGKGFTLQQGLAGGGVGLTGMQERGAEIGWALKINTAPGMGTCIRLEKSQPVETGLGRDEMPLDLSTEGPS